MSRKQGTMYVCIVGILLVVMGISQAAPMGTAFTYQGRLTDAGNPANESYDFIFRLYDASSGGNLLGTDTAINVTPQDGYFKAELDFGSGVFAGEARWLEIRVAPAGSGSYTPLSPRQEMTPTPYALYALNAPGGSGFWADSGNNIYNTNSGNVGIGTNDPKVRLSLGAEIPPWPKKLAIWEGIDDFYGFGADWGRLTVYANNEEKMTITDTGNVGVGTTTPNQKLDIDLGNIVVQGTGSFDETGEEGSVYLGSIHHYIKGVHGFGVKIGTYAVGDVLSIRELSGSVGIGTTNPSAKLEVVGDVSASGSSSGAIITGTNTGSTGEGVHGEATGDSGRGVRGVAPGSSGQGVQGYASNAGIGARNYGGFFKALGEEGTGVNGEATGRNGVGVRGSSTGTNGVGGWFNASVASNGYGVMAWGNNYDFYAAGAGTDYGPFTGGHEVKLSDDFPVAVKPGMIVSVTGQAQVRRDEEGTVTISSTLPTAKLCDVANDKAVLGVLVKETLLHKEHWYEATETERFAVVNALGEGRVWVCNVNGEIEAGDYITTSTVPGYGQRQDDDLLHSFTLGKAIETIDWDSVTEIVEFNGQTYKVYLIAVVYTSG